MRFTDMVAVAMAIVVALIWVSAEEPRQTHEPITQECLACKAESVERLLGADPALIAEAAIKAAAEHQQIPVDLLMAMARVESNLDPAARSKKGAIGLLQVVPESAGREVYRLWGRSGQPTVADLERPEYNAAVAAAYLAWLTETFGEQTGTEAVVAAYNAGPTRVRSCQKEGGAWKACLPPETRGYLEKIDQEMKGRLASVAL